MARCRLCLKDEILRNSHIVPEFLYGQLYNDKGHMMGIHGRGKRGWKALQKGLRERLFCDACEQHLNEHFEKPFHASWVASPPLPDPWPGADLVSIQMDYAPFKLFHMSVLFRAGVSALPTFAAVSLGPHEEKLRRMILACEPGDWWQYPVVGCAVVHHRTRRVVQLVTMPTATKVGGRRCYSMMYGGAHWSVGVYSGRNAGFECAALRPDGTMALTPVPLNQFGVIRDASAALRSAGS